MIRRAFRRSAPALGVACALTYLVTVPASRAADVASDPSLAALSPLELRASLGSDGEAERDLRAAVAAGDSTARDPLLALLVRRGHARDAHHLLERWGGPGALSGEGALFLVAYLAERRGDPDGALEAYRAAAVQDPLLADHAMFRCGIVLQTLGRPVEAIAAFDGASEAARTNRLGALAAFRAAGLATDADDPARARELLDRVPVRSAVPRADRLALEARIARAAGDSTAERDALRRLLRAAPGAPALEAMDRLAAVAVPTVEDRLEWASVALAAGHPSRAEEEAGAALRDAGTANDPVREGRARLLRGRARAARRELTAAREELARLPSGARAADRAAAALEAARCLWKLGQIDAALTEYDAIARSSFPDSIRALAAWEAAREAKDDGRSAEAASRYGDFRRAWPRHEFADDALWQRGRALAEAGDGPGAAAAFDELTRLYPASPVLEEAVYWTARVYRAAGDSGRTCAAVDSLRARFPDGYWTGRAADLAPECGGSPPPLGEVDVTTWLADAFPGARAPAPLAIRSSEPFRRARVLASVGLREDAEAELSGLRRMLDAEPAGLVALAQEARTIGLPREAMRVVSTLKLRTRSDVLAGDFPPALSRLLYPVVHLDAVRRWAGENRLDPFFVYAVMREESWLDPAAVSSAGARGLLQIMPVTGYDLAARDGLRGFSAEDLFDPDTSVRLGTRYLRELLDAFQREPVLALAAYNAGKGNAMRWREGQEGGFDVDRYVTSITYRETYGYVQKVMRTYAIYRALWGAMLDGPEGSPAAVDRGR